MIDEIQMLSDPDRGWAWTNALFGVPARTVIVCGSDDALSYVRRAAEAANESLDVVPFERKSPLLLQEEAVPLETVEPGDAVVAFSRRAVHENRESWSPAGTGSPRSTARCRRRFAAPRPRGSARARPTSSSRPTRSAWASTWGR